MNPLPFLELSFWHCHCLDCFWGCLVPSTRVAFLIFVVNVIFASVTCVQLNILFASHLCWRSDLSMLISLRTRQLNMKQHEWVLVVPWLIQLWLKKKRSLKTSEFNTMRMQNSCEHIINFCFSSWGWWWCHSQLPRSKIECRYGLRGFEGNSSIKFLINLMSTFWIL